MTKAIPVRPEDRARICQDVWLSIPQYIHPSIEEALAQTRLAALDEAAAEMTELRIKISDRDYMIIALVNMLGPVATEVWHKWQAAGTERVHFNWGPSAAKLSGEERAQVILDWEAAPRTEVTNVDAHVLALKETPDAK